MNQTGLSGSDKDRLYQAAELFLQARRTGEPLEDLPTDLRPRSSEEAWYVQDLLIAAIGPLGGWKIGAASPDALPVCAPMPRAGFLANGGTAAGANLRLRGVEAEIAFLLGQDLPPRPTPYSRAELVLAIASCHPAIELLESALLDPDRAGRLTAAADLQSHGGFVYGESVPGWQELDLAAETAQMSVDGFIRVSDGKNTAGSDLLRLLVWLANEAQGRTGGLRAGQWITTGSWTGKTLATSGAVVAAHFPHFGTVTARFA